MTDLKASSEELAAEVEKLQKRLARERAKREQLEALSFEKTQELYREKQKLLLLNQLISTGHRNQGVVQASNAISSILMSFNQCDGMTVVSESETGLSIYFHADNTDSKRLAVGILDSDEIRQAMSKNPATTCEFKQALSGVFLYRLLIPLDTQQVAFVVLTFTAKQRMLDLDPDVITHVRRELDRIYEREHDAALIYHISHHDHLTQLQSKETFITNLQQKISTHLAEKGQIGIVLIDVIGMRLINSEHSMAFGNKLLQHIAYEISSHLRQNDCVCRFTGNTFAFYVQAEDVEEAICAIVDRIYHCFDGEIKFDNKCAKVRFNTAYSILDRLDTAAEQVMQQAEIALKQAKKFSDSCPMKFKPEMMEQEFSAHRQQEDLRTALENNQFKLMYQPIIDLRTGHVVNAEALLRWYPDGDDSPPVSPVQFIPLLEQTNLILPVGRWLLRQALYDLKRVRDMGLTLHQISVNVSAKQFYDVGIHSYIEGCFREFKLEHDCLNLEITESTYLDSTEIVDGFFEDVKSIGVNVSLDDFGTGYSSLSHLHRYPISRLKIDRSFITNLEQGDKHVRLLESIIAIGKSLDMKSVAEGIETQESAKVARDLGVHYGQGYYFSRPLLFDDLCDFIKDSQSNCTEMKSDYSI